MNPKEKDELREQFKEGDWAAYNWLTDEGEDHWKIGRIVKTEHGLMYFNDDWTHRSGYIPLTSPGVKLLSNKVEAFEHPQPLDAGELDGKMWLKVWDIPNTKVPNTTMKEAEGPKDIHLSDLLDHYLLSQKRSAGHSVGLDAGEHPENYCNDCGQRNPTWYAPNELWNTLCERHEIICPVCFQKRAGASGMNIIFTTEDLKKQPVLDSGEWLKERGLKESIIKFIDGDPDDPEEFYLGDLLKDFAQASITAKQKEWEEEKEKLEKLLITIYYERGISDRIVERIENLVFDKTKSNE